jgi:cytochrome c556
MAGGMVAAGRRAAAAARDRKPEDVLAAGEQIYTACTRCHTKYLVDVTVTP